MEARLRELKRTIDTQRATRAAHGGAGWRSALPGAASSLRRTLPVSPGGAMRRGSSGSPAGGGVLCGQCETVAAALHCAECGEEYCKPCFVAFHRKGALRQHRCTPVATPAPPAGPASPRRTVARASRPAAVSTSSTEGTEPPASPNDSSFAAAVQEWRTGVYVFFFFLPQAVH